MTPEHRAESSQSPALLRVAQKLLPRKNNQKKKFNSSIETQKKIPNMPRQAEEKRRKRTEK